MNRMMNISKWTFMTLALALFLVGFASCGESIPKPRGYFRIDLPEKEYARYENEQFPCRFDYAGNVSTVNFVKVSNDSAWVDIVYPKYNAKIYCTYKELSGDFQKVSEESRKLVYKPHTVKADAITEQAYLNDESRVYGILYELKGNTASNIQFVLSDSTKHFLRGALYFNVNPNKDSIAPVVDYIREDIIRLVETLEWSKK